MREPMRVLTSAAGDRNDIAAAFADPARLVVVSLCAAWCDTCNEFRSAYGRLAQVRPQATFVWLDIEDDAALCGDIDVENFPTLAIYRGNAPVPAVVRIVAESVRNGAADCQDTCRALERPRVRPRRAEASPDTWRLNQSCRSRTVCPAEGERARGGGQR